MVCSVKWNQINYPAALNPLCAAVVCLGRLWGWAVWSGKCKIGQRWACGVLGWRCPWAVLVVAQLPNPCPTLLALPGDSQEKCQDLTLPLPSEENKIIWRGNEEHLADEIHRGGVTRRSCQ